ncbi:PilN domain-containing protein [Patescibacteria group bacterium]
MINLLPTLEKKNLLKEEKWKLILIIELIVLFFLISLFLIFLSIKVYIGSRLEAQQIVLSQEREELEKTEINAFKAELGIINNQLEKLESFYDQEKSFTNFFKEIANLTPKEIIFNQISINSTDASRENFQISLSGYAPRVENLIEMRQNLNKDERFNQVYFPSSIWIKESDINFNITFQVVFDK